MTDPTMADEIDGPDDGPDAEPDADEAPNADDGDAGFERPMPQVDPTLPQDLVLEAALFSAGRPMAVEDIQAATGLTKKDIGEGLRILKANYEGRHSALDVVQAGSKWALILKARYADQARHIVPAEIPKHTLKTLALIAYHQPLLQSDLKDMVGSKVYEHVGILVEGGLVSKRPEGLSFLLSTSNDFPEYFGIPGTTADEIRQVLADRVGTEVEKRAFEEGEAAVNASPDEVLSAFLNLVQDQLEGQDE